MPTLFCCILNCESESVNCKKRKIFYRFPQNCDRKQLWLNQIGDRIKYGTVSSNSRICNLHFATGKPNLDSSHIDYMPTIFPWSTKEDKLKSVKSVEEYESKIKELEQKILAKAFLNASSGSKIPQESSTAKFDLPENDLCSKLIGNSELSAVGDFGKHRAQKAPTKLNSIVDPVHGGLDPKLLIAASNSLDKSHQHPLQHLHHQTAAELTKLPIFKDSMGNAHSTHQHQHHISSGSSIQSAPNGQQAVQLIPPDNNTVSIKSNLLNYLLSSIARVNMANNNNNNGSDLAKSSLPVNVSMPTGPLNLSQSYNKLDEHTVKKEKINEIVAEAVKKEMPKKELVNQPDPNSEISSNLPHRKNSFAVAQTPDRTATPGEETSSRSCTCTKSSCLKLYCECFANGNLCCSGCTCINCRNNDNHKEERTKIVNSYLERDPWVFNSKIENKDVGKKHSKGCNCLKSSCLKNYCECFENKVFCSSLCRCRMCYNNEEHTQHNNRDDAKIYASSHTSESLSVLSENSPRDPNRKRKKSSIKINEIYEDVSSNESEDEINSKRCQLDSETVSMENDKRSNRSINSMEIPPVLPQEDDFTEEELALMVKFREQRTEKPSMVKRECVSPASQPAQTHLNSSSGVPKSSPLVNAPPVINIPAHLDPNLLLTLSKSLAVANLGFNGLNVINTTMQDPKRASGIDLLSLLATQQLMVARQPTEVANLNCITVPQANCTHALPTNLSQMPASCISQISQISSTAAITSQARVITTSPTSVTSSLCQSKPKLSTEDYVRKHIEAAERAVRADYMRKDNSSYKKPITKQKVKIEPFPVAVKSQQLSNIRPAAVGSNSSVNNESVRPVTISQPPQLVFGKPSQPLPPPPQPQPPQPSHEDTSSHTANCHSAVASLSNGKPNGSSIHESSVVTTTSPISSDATSQPISNLALYNWVTVTSNNSQNPSVLHTVQLNCQSSGSLPAEHVDTFVKPDSAAPDSSSNSKTCTKSRNKSLRHSLQSLRCEIRSLKFHMRADQSRLRRLEKNMHLLRSQIGK